METTPKIALSKDLITSTIYSSFALVIVYFLPAISHLFSFPVYYIDPMRIIVLLSLVHTKKENAVILALTLPIFSFLVSSHPVFAKSGLIVMELFTNVILFLYLSKKYNLFISAIIAIILSKVVYYVAKYIFINLSIINDKLFSTPIYIQLITAIVLSLYIFYFTKKKETK